MKNIEYYTVGTTQKSNSKIVHRQNQYSNTQIHDRSLPCVWPQVCSEFYSSNFLFHHFFSSQFWKRNAGNIWNKHRAWHFYSIKACHCQLDMRIKMLLLWCFRGNISPDSRPIWKLSLYTCICCLFGGVITFSFFSFSVFFVIIMT